MSAKLFFLPYQTATIAGIAAPGAKLYFYTTGTTTPLPIYSDSGLSVELTNPVTANGAGKFADIYLDSTKTYRLIIKDKNGSTLDDIDPYLPGTAPDASSLQPYADDAADSAVAASTSASAADTSADAAAASATSADSDATSAASSAALATAAASAAASSIASVPNATAHAATRTALAALSSASGPVFLRESGREGMFVWDSSDLSAKVTADTAQGVYVAPASATTGASGAWVRKFTGRHNVKWFGAIGDDVTNDGAAFLAALTFLNGIGRDGTYGYPGRTTPSLFIPAGRYFLGTSTLDIVSTMVIEGEGVGSEAAASTVLRWSAGATGIRVQAATTSGDTTSGLALTYSGDGSIIKGLCLIGGYSAVEADYHGIHLRARATVQDCFIDLFQGEGIYILANAATSNGNANNWRVERTTIQRCRTGLFTDGPDVNAGHGLAISVNSCRAWGIWDSSFLGNAYMACHVASCTTGAYKSDSTTACNTFLNCYSESGQPTSSFTYPTLVLGGLHAAGVDTTSFGGWLTSNGSTLNAQKDLLVNNNVDARGLAHTFGPQSGSSDATTYFYTANTHHYQWGKYKDGTNIGYVDFRHLWGVDISTLNVGYRIALQSNGTDILNIDANGAIIATGKALYYGATAVLSGGVLAAAAFPALTGDVTTSAGSLATAIASGVVSLSKMANLAANSIIGNNTGSPAVPLALTGTQVAGLLSTAVSGGAQGAMTGQDKARLDASFTRYHSLLDCSGWLTAADAAATYGMGQGDKLAVTGTGTQYPLNVIYIAAADYPAAGTLAAKLRIRVQIHCNDVAPGVTFTIGLHPVTRPATSGAAGLCIYTVGSAVASSTVAIATPAADSSNIAVTAADFALPADGYYVVGVVTSGGALAASSHVHVNSILQMRYA